MVKKDILQKGFLHIVEFQKDMRSSSPSHCSDDEKRFSACTHGFRQSCIQGCVRAIFLACKETDERPTLARDMIADGPAQHRELRLQCVQHGSDGRRRGDVDLHFATHPREGAQVKGKDDPDHGSVCTSTERTFGRFAAIICQWSPPSGEQ